MAIIGIRSIIYGVHDMEASIRFYRDFGLLPVRENADGADFLLPDQSTVLLRKADDPLLPPAFEAGSGVRRVIWAVDSRQSLETLERDLKTDREVRRGDEDTICLNDDAGLPIGLTVAQPATVHSPPELTNAPGRVERWNRHRTWYEKAEPKLMQHVVFCHENVRKAAAFYVRRLHFRVSDIQQDAGYFLRADGRNEHHNIFWQPGKQLGFRHVAFGVENIDELMVGASEMQRRGWPSALGLGRHRISSTHFYYIKSPCGGDTEYSTDTDYLDDHWTPRVWGRTFGHIYWASRPPEKVAPVEVRLATAADLSF